jgi:hypothetical protein
LPFYFGKKAALWRQPFSFVVVDLCLGFGDAIDWANGYAGPTINAKLSVNDVVGIARRNGLGRTYFGAGPAADTLITIDNMRHRLPPFSGKGARGTAPG